jgi:hypothetical protein
MARYPSVLFPALYYGAQYGFASILPAVTVASIFSAAFHWNTLEIGLAYGGALSIGGNSIPLYLFPQPIDTDIIQASSENSQLVSF